MKRRWNVFTAVTWNIRDLTLTSNLWRFSLAKNLTPRPCVKSKKVSSFAIVRVANLVQFKTLDSNLKAKSSKLKAKWKLKLKRNWWNFKRKFKLSFRSCFLFLSELKLKTKKLTKFQTIVSIVQTLLSISFQVKIKTKLTKFLSFKSCFLLSSFNLKLKRDRPNFKR